MVGEPCAGVGGYPLKRAGLFEQVGRAGNDYDTALTAHECLGPPVELRADVMASVRCGSTCRRTTRTSGKSMSYQSTVGGGLTRNILPSSPAPRSSMTASGWRVTNRRTTSSSLFGPYLDVEDLGPRVEELRAERGEPGEVVPGLSEDLVGHGVAEEGARQAAVERPAAQREEQARDGRAAAHGSRAACRSVSSM